MMRLNLFEFYGHFCARYALEVLVCFVTMVVAAITLNVSSPYELCHWATNCVSKSSSESEISSDIVLLTLLRCGTILYVYMQLKKLWRIGSVIIVAIICSYTVFAVMTFSIAILHFLRKDLVIVSNALPVFLLLIDVSRMVIVTQHCLSMKSIDLLHEYIAEAMSALSPMATLDTLIEILVLVNIGAFVQIHQIQQLTCFACLSVIINYIVFTTFVPACLSVLLTLINKTPTDVTLVPSWHDVRFKKILQNEKHRHVSILPNHVKLILCAGLLTLQVVKYSRLTSNVKETSGSLQNSFDSLLSLNPEQFFTLILILILVSKYLLDDGYEIVSRLRRHSDTCMDSKASCPDIESKLSHSEEKIESLSDEQSCSSLLPRSFEDCLRLLKVGSDLLTNREIISLVEKNKLALYKLESELRDANRAVLLRREIFSKKMRDVKRREALQRIPHIGYDFTNATKACCENTVGYIPVPVGVVGPLLLNGKEYRVPMATTEGTLLASTNRGLKALYLSGGVKGHVYRDGMSRAPVVAFPSTERCCEMSDWLQDFYNFNLVKEKFDETSRFGKLKSISPVVSGRLLFVRFVATTGDAMGMNMVSKGAENALRWLQQTFTDMEVISLSGNFCTDKKPSAINWIEGRGKSVVCEAVLPAKVVKKVLKTDAAGLVRLSHCKNLIGSAMSGSIGGFNAHAANIVTAMFIATGQDPAQNVVSSNCLTNLELSRSQDGDDGEMNDPSLLVTCTMPSLEVATVGGGSTLDPQRACLGLLGIAGASASDKPGANSTQLAKIICATVLAGELSLLAALNSGDLVQSHMKHNRLPKGTKPDTDHSIL
ncbi:3-hydroxy-3-methylglutaryl-coenzyme A reductase-like [Clavelina lepadiformis]|uniref:3-hydroxy-3-methylglutaryl coenzyme A reductase n=1 Tax=Clavelina lepadiformis TaxID=159417 RepID=A0ABP0GR53_CLALP